MDMNNSTRKMAIRFSDREKQFLFGLLHKYENIIDYRQRKNTVQKQSDVRKCWDTILRTFNEHPGTTDRTLKQLQKFWLNSKYVIKIINQIYQHIKYIIAYNIYITVCMLSE